MYQITLSKNNLSIYLMYFSSVGHLHLDQYYQEATEIDVYVLSQIYRFVLLLNKLYICIYIIEEIYSSIDIKCIIYRSRTWINIDVSVCLFAPSSSHLSEVSCRPDQRDPLTAVFWFRFALHHMEMWPKWSTTWDLY